MHLRRTFLVLLLLGCTLTHSLQASAWSNVAINGQRLTQVELVMLERSIGARIAPGLYLVNTQGCWVNLTNGQSGCLNQKGGSYISRYGSGERGTDGSWNHWSGAAGAGVGGTSDGCIYTTTGWSNC
jgi:hypothetical protein